MNVENEQSSYSITGFGVGVCYSFSWHEVTLILCWFYRAAQILCKYCQVHFWNITNIICWYIWHWWYEVWHRYRRGGGGGECENREGNR